MKTLIIVLLIAFAVLAVVGFVVEALLWLAVIALILFAATVVYGFIKNKASRSKGSH
ncbi:hypothetical protein [Demequina sp. SO4-18]|uniref:hypothetical protein n=1 Tax=Demequina sp. SO4-18 TaxID=3401026 RepID=UPI003B5B6DFE